MSKSFAKTTNSTVTDQFEKRNRKGSGTSKQEFNGENNEENGQLNMDLENPILSSTNEEFD
jgi:hypothetical protein